jgi:hypothetical protein
MWDLLKELLSPILTLIHERFSVTVAVVPQPCWDMRKRGDIKTPTTQSATLIVFNASGHSINTHEAAVCFRDKTEVALHFENPNLPVEVKARDRTHLTLNPGAFEELAQHRLNNVRCFYVEDALFHRYKVFLSKRTRNDLLQNYYLVTTTSRVLQDGLTQDFISAP